MLFCYYFLTECNVEMLQLRQNYFVMLRALSLIKINVNKVDDDNSFIMIIMFYML